MGTQDKTRYKPFHFFIEFNEKKELFELATDPDTYNLEQLSELLLAEGRMNQSKFFDLAKTHLGLKGKQTFLKLLKKGINKFWSVRREKKVIYYATLLERSVDVSESADLDSMDDDDFEPTDDIEERVGKVYLKDVFEPTDDFERKVGKVYLKDVYEET